MLGHTHSYPGPQSEQTWSSLLKLKGGEVLGGVAPLGGVVDQHAQNPGFSPRTHKPGMVAVHACKHSTRETEEKSSGSSLVLQTVKSQHELQESLSSGNKEKQRTVISARGIAQQIKGLAAKPDSPSSIPRTHIVDGENQIQKTAF